MTRPSYIIEKHWDDNERVTERNGRIYVSRGRWQWIVIGDRVPDSAHDRKRDAVARLASLTAGKGAK